MELILTCAYCTLFYYIIRKSNFFKSDVIAPWLLAVFFILKCASGIILGLVYTLYYTNHNDTDTFKFFTDSKIMFDSIYTHPYDFFRMFTGINEKSPDTYPYFLKMNSWLNTNPGVNDNKTIIRMNAFFRFFSLGYYNVHVVFLNFLSFTGLFCLYKTFISYCPEKKKELLILIFLMPSLLFWGSGLLKDGILITGFGLLIFSFDQVLKKGVSSKKLMGLLISIGILFLTKTYVLAIIIPGLFAWWLTYRSSSRKIIITFISIYALYFITAFNAYRFNPVYNVAALLFYKHKNFVDIGNEHSASMISVPDFECSGPSIMLSSPHAFCNTMFRPFLTDIKGNPMILMAALENILIALMIVACLLSFKVRGKRTEAIIILSGIFVIILFVLIGLITPVLGAIVRYKIVALPCLVFILVYYYDKAKLVKRLPFLTRRDKSETR